MKCIGISAPGPHAFILVLKIKRFTKEENDTINYFREVFGEGMLNYLFVLFTGIDDLEAEERTLEDYVTKAPADLKTLLKDCHGKYFGINNREKDQNRKEKQVSDLMLNIKSNVLKNGGKHYTTEMLEAAEEQMRKREQEILKQKEEELRRQEQQIMEKFEATQAKIEEKYRKEKERMQRELALIEKENKARMEALAEKQKREAAEAKARQDEYIARLQKEGELQRAEMEKRQLQEERERERAQKEEERKRIEQEHEKRIESELQKIRDKLVRDEEERKRREEEVEKLMKKKEEEALIKAREKAREETETGGGVMGYLWNGVKYWLGW
ncbi:protein MNN4-like [Gigantopelta aegis]|uniref:protein MNN4-like n=1 Tax=Gigantopelta aegis TaxID=1735272 RepID=UPI001B88DD95|nr:protein MNN4-like [Gigantopelta aegis]